MKKFGEKSLRFLLSSVLILNMFMGLSTNKVRGVSFDGGSGTVEDPYIISTAEQLDTVRDNHSASYKLANDIDLTDYIDKKYGAEGWKPIGGHPDPYSFDGNFDGNGYKISGLWINRPAESNVAFFGGFKGDNTEIKNLNIELSPKGIVGKNYVGGVVGNNEGGLISGCSVTGGPLVGEELVGKLVGESHRNIRSCYTSGEAVTSNSPLTDSARGIGTGGLVGKISNSSCIEDCFSACDVIKERGMSTGGFAGWSEGNSEIRRCYATGNVLGGSTDDNYPVADTFGGFIGHNDRATVKDCYVTGNLTKGHKVGSGGFAGTSINYSSSVIHNCYACCEEVNYSEAFIGYNRATSRTEKCYYDSDKGIKRDCGGRASNSTLEAYGKTTEEMYKKATYEGWDFDTIWDIKEGESYPYLRSSLPMYYSFGPRSAVYTGSDQGVEITKNKCGEAAGAGNATAVMYSGATTKPVNVGKYEISVNLGAGSATNPTTGVKLSGSYTIEKATLNLEHFNYDLSTTSYEEGVKRPAILSAKPGTAFTNEINDLIRNGKIWLEYKTEGENWTKDAPINAAKYEVKIVVGKEAKNFKPAEFTIGNYLIGEKRSIIYKNYDGSDITELDSSLPTEYIEGTEVTIPQTAPNAEMEGWDFLGYWDCALDNSQDSLVDLEGSGYENEKSLNFKTGTKVETISKDSKGDVTVFARYSSEMFDADINGRENYIFASPGVFPNGTTASMRILEKGTEEYEKVLSDVDKKDKHNVKIVEFEVFDKNGEKIQPKTFFGNTVIGFKIPEDFKVDDTSLIRVTSGEDINLRSTIWSDPENPSLKYIEGTTDHFSPYAILSPWSDFLDADESDFTETGETNWVLIAFIVSAIVIVSTLAVLWYKKRHPKNYKHS